MFHSDLRNGCLSDAKVREKCETGVHKEYVQSLTFGKDTESSQNGSKVKEMFLQLPHFRELQSCPTNTSNKSDASSALYHLHHLAALHGERGERWRKVHTTHSDSRCVLCGI